MMQKRRHCKKFNRDSLIASPSYCPIRHIRHHLSSSPPSLIRPLRMHGLSSSPSPIFLRNNRRDSARLEESGQRKRERRERREEGRDGARARGTALVFFAAHVFCTLPLCCKAFFSLSLVSLARFRSTILGSFFAVLSKPRSHLAYRYHCWACAKIDSFVALNLLFFASIVIFPSARTIFAYLLFNSMLGMIRSSITSHLQALIGCWKFDAVVILAACFVLRSLLILLIWPVLAIKFISHLTEYQLTMSQWIITFSTFWRLLFPSPSNFAIAAMESGQPLQPLPEQSRTDKQESKAQPPTAPSHHQQQQPPQLLHLQVIYTGYIGQFRIGCRALWRFVSINRNTSTYRC